MATITTSISIRSMQWVSSLRTSSSQSFSHLQIATILTLAMVIQEVICAIGMTALTPTTAETTTLSISKQKKCAAHVEVAPQLL